MERDGLTVFGAMTEIEAGFADDLANSWCEPLKDAASEIAQDMVRAWEL